MMRSIHFHGAAGRKFGRVFHVAADSPQKALSHLLRLVPGLKEFVRQHEWILRRGAMGPSRVSTNEAELQLSFGRCAEFHLLPAASFAKRGASIGKIVLGVALIGAAIFFSGGTAAGLGAALPGALGEAGLTFGSVALFGGSLLLTGMSQFLAGNPSSGSSNKREDPAQQNSFLFSGPTNVTQEGQPIYLTYGTKIRVGSVVASAGITTEQIAV